MAGAAVIKRLSRRAESKGEKPFVDPNEVDVNGNPKIACPHGIARASFRTWALNDDLGNDKRFTQRTAELCLHHNVSDAYNGAYERNEALKSRAESLMHGLTIANKKDKRRWMTKRPSTRLK